MHITGKLGLARQDVHLSVYAISNAQHWILNFGTKLLVKTTLEKKNLKKKIYELPVNEKPVTQ